MVHTGIGPYQVNTLLTSLNIPSVSSWTLQNRQHETGPVLEKTAVESTRSSLHDEIQATVSMIKGTVKLTVSVDAGWQKPGSGPSFDSLSGHCSMIESQTGKVMKSERNVAQFLKMLLQMEKTSKIMTAEKTLITMRGKSTCFNFKCTWFFFKLYGEARNIFLVGHNIKGFDFHVLFHTLDSCSLFYRVSNVYKFFF
ncbi:uncharacterized protein LOC134243205 isoform X2 [Saccostrea cucullata]